MRWISSVLPCSRPPQSAVRNPVFESNRGPDEYHWWREGLNASDDGNSNWRNLLSHAYNLYYNHWTAGQRNDFQVATLAAYWDSKTDRHDEASLDRAVGKAVDDAVDDLMSVYSRSPFEIAIGDQASSDPHAGLIDTHDLDRRNHVERSD